MGDVLVYMDPAVNGRLLAFARPLADAAGGALVALVASGEPVGADALAAPTSCSRSPTPRSPRTSRRRTRPCSPPRSGSARRTSCWSRTRPPATTSAPRRPRRADLPFVGYCLGVSLAGGEAESTSAIYGGQLQATSRTPLPAVFAINSVALHDEPQRRRRGERATLAPPAELDGLRTTFVETVEPADEGVDLESADLIVCVGRGIGGAENIEVAEELAEALGAELAASRPVIDSGWVPKARQIGKSGAQCSPKLYLGLGVSGAPEHVEGMQGAELIIAVNTDPGAAIFNVAHYGAVADLFDVADELTEQLG